MQDKIPTEVLSTTIGDLVIWITFFSLLIGGVVWTRKNVAPFFHKVRLFLEDWNGEEARPGVPRRPGMNERLTNVEKELKPNGGKSVYDKVEYTAKQQVSHQVAISEIKDDISRLNDAVGLVGKTANDINDKVTERGNNGSPPG